MYEMTVGIQTPKKFSNTSCKNQKAIYTETNTVYYLSKLTKNTAYNENKLFVNDFSRKK